MEIKYKAWDEARKEWIPGNLLFMDYDGQVLAGDIYNPPFTLISPKNVVINTGLKDKNGREIYEGDVITIPAWRNAQFKVVFEAGMFRAVEGERKISMATFKGEVRCEVIGNIFENSELLEVSE